MGMMAEFKEFAMRGNAIDLAVGVVIGAAFGKIVTALVDNVIMPPFGLLIGGVDFADWAWTLKEASVDAAGNPVAAVSIGIGTFLNAVIQFLIVAFVVFLLVKGINKLRREQAPEAAGPTATEALLAEIRDELKARPNA